MDRRWMPLRDLASLALSKVRLHLLRPARNELQLRVPSPRRDEQFLQLRPGSFCGLTIGRTIDPHAVQVAHPERRCFPSLSLASEVAERSNCQNRLAASCPGWERIGRMNPVQ